MVHFTTELTWETGRNPAYFFALRNAASRFSRAFRSILARNGDAPTGSVVVGALPLLLLVTPPGSCGLDSASCDADVGAASPSKSGTKAQKKSEMVGSAVPPKYACAGLQGHRGAPTAGRCRTAGA